MKDDKTFSIQELQKDIMSLDRAMEYSRREIDRYLRQLDVKQAKDELEKFRLYADEFFDLHRLLEKEINKKD